MSRRKEKGRKWPRGEIGGKNVEREGQRRVEQRGIDQACSDSQGLRSNPLRSDAA